MRACFRGVVEGPDWLRGVRKRRVVLGDDDLRNHRGDRSRLACRSQRVTKCLLEQVADLPLRRGDCHIQVVLVDDPGRLFRSNLRGINLRAVAVRDHDVVSRLDQPDEIAGRAAGIGALVRQGGRPSGREQRVTADGNKHELAHGSL